MIWLTFRQFRFSTIVAVVALALVASVFGATGRHLAHLYDSSGIQNCTASSDDCGLLIDQFLTHYRVLQWAGLALLAIPPVVGVFWGAPLAARELESGTYRMVWTQSTTRTRWLIVKLVVLGAASVAVAGLLSLILTWWSGPIDAARANRFSPAVFSERGIVPAGYAAFAFTFGVAAGLVLRRAVPAMATTLVVFAVVWLSVMLWVRPHLEAPIEVATAAPALPSGPPDLTRAPMPFDNGVTQPGDWVLSEVLTDASGRSTTSIRCSGGANCLAGYTHKVTYQPASRFWRFQWMETGIYAGLSVICVAFSLWWIRYRVT